MERKVASPSRKSTAAGSRRGDASPAGRPDGNRRSGTWRGRGPCPNRPLDLISKKVNTTCLPVIDGLPQTVPVLERELDVIETYLGALIDELLKTEG